MNRNLVLTMINFIPIFPLNIVIYPGEALNLHIFEPRYKELIKECIAEKKPFGIPSIHQKQLAEFGTLMEVTELVSEYENGEMDIRTKGIKVFKILEYIKELPDKLYSGAIVNYPDNIMAVDDSRIAHLIIEEVKRFYTLLNLEDKFSLLQHQVLSYEIAHFVGFTNEQKYELLSIFNEIQRLEYIRRHLKSVVPVLKELEDLKERIKMNGHFRDLSARDFDI
jgi:Lon protease-like protein